MAYVTISPWTATEWNDGMEAQATSKFVPMIMSVGATGVQMIRTSDLSMCVLTQYPDEATAQSAQQKIAEIRAQAATEFPMRWTSVCGVSFHRRLIA